MNNVIIIGARGWGREWCEQLKYYPDYQKKFKIKGFLDDNSELLKGLSGYPPILSSVEDYQVEENDVFLCALGDIDYRKKYIEIIKNKGGYFGTFIDPTSRVFETAKLGEGVLVLPFCIVSSDVVIGDFTSLQPYCIIGHDAKVGRYCAIESSSFVGGGAIVADNCILHTRSTVIPKVHVNENVVIGAGSVVIKNIPANTTVFGVPARKVVF